MTDQIKPLRPDYSGPEFNVYQNPLDCCQNQILNAFDADINSPSFGCFDRAYWGWKKKDIADITLQFAAFPVYLAETHDTSRELMIAAADFVMAQSYANGAVDQSYPYEGHPKTFLDVSSLFVALLLDPDVSSEQKQKFKTALHKSSKFSCLKDETYAFISNHIACDMYQFLTIWQVTGDRVFLNESLRCLQLLGENRTKSGGFMEYDGLDLGYQTRTLKFLVQSINLFPEPQQQQSCFNEAAACAGFVFDNILPDGAVYGMLGNRSVELVYPSGLEFFAALYPAVFGKVMIKVRHALRERRLHQPDALDFDNMIRLYEDFVRVGKLQPDTLSEAVELQQGLTIINSLREHVNRYPEDGYTRSFSLQGYDLFIGNGAGNAVVLFHGEICVFKDAGVLLQERAGRRGYATRNLLVNSKLHSETEGEFVIKSQLAGNALQNLTPLKLILLRTLNMTVLRFGWVADAFRKVLVRFLIKGDSAAYEVLKTVTMQPDRLVITEKIEHPRKVDWRFTAVAYLHTVYMASSRYSASFRCTQNVSRVEELDFEGHKGVTRVTRSFTL